ncbi:MAG TPA: hypothetical protein VF712_07380 [Thermoleophilaceae bacterium]
MKGQPAYVRLILFFALVVPGALTTFLLREASRQAAAEHNAARRRPAPEPPKLPSDAIEHTGPASDGGRVVVRRNRAWLWVRVEHEGTSDCRPASTTANGFLYGESPKGVRADGSFELRGGFVARWHVPDLGRKTLPHRLDGKPDQVTYRIAGRFDGRGGVRGRFERLDRVLDGDSVALRCRYRSSWTAAQPG